MVEGPEAVLALSAPSPSDLNIGVGPAIEYLSSPHFSLARVGNSNQIRFLGF